MDISQVAPDPVLSSVSILQFSSGAFLIDRLMPVVPVGADQFRVAVYDASDVTDDVAVDRAIGASANEVSMSQTWIKGMTSRASLKMKLPREIVAQSMNPEATRKRRISVVNGKIRLALEKRFAKALKALTAVGTITTKWDAAAGVGVKANIDAFKALFRAQCGRLPNTIAFGYQVAQAVANDSDVRARQQANNNETLTNGDLPSVLFNLNVAVGGSMAKNTPAGELEEIWNTDDVWLAYVDPEPSEESFGFGAQFRAPAAGGVPVASQTWPDPDVSCNSDWYYTEVNQTEIIQCAAAIMRIENVLSGI
jgi:hypothetical protein